MKYTISAISNVGCVRHQNEDMILVDSYCLRNVNYFDEISFNNRDRLLIALADGMGGHKSGDVASSMVLDNLSYYFNDLPKGLQVDEFNEAIFEWLESMNNIIDSKSRSDERFYQMGTTLVAFAYFAGEFYWMNCGDSRIYRFHDGVLSQLSTDHSLSNLVGSSEHSNIITNCIGGGVKMSYIDLQVCTPDVLPGDVFMLCSDGLSDMVSDTDIQSMLCKGADAVQLCNAAIAAGGFDNVSVCVIRIE